MGRADHYKEGDWNAICDSCGFKFKFSKLKRMWDGTYKCSKCFEERHPQDFVRGVKDRQVISDARPDSEPTFTTEAQTLPLPPE